MMDVRQASFLYIPKDIRTMTSTIVIAIIITSIFTTTTGITKFIVIIVILKHCNLFRIDRCMYCHSIVNLLATTSMV